MDTELIKGKWYALLNGRNSVPVGWYIKFNEIDNKGVICSDEYITDDKKYYKTLGTFGKKGNYNYELVSIDMIRHLLPKDYKIDEVINDYLPF